MPPPPSPSPPPPVYGIPVRRGRHHLRPRLRPLRLSRPCRWPLPGTPSPCPAARTRGRSAGTSRAPHVLGVWRRRLGFLVSGGAPFATILTQNVPVGADCTLTMYDTWGDGWNGNTWSGLFNTASLVSGNSGTFTFTVGGAFPSPPPPPPPKSPPAFVMVTHNSSCATAGVRRHREHPPVLGRGRGWVCRTRRPQTTAKLGGRPLIPQGATTNTRPSSSTQAQTQVRAMSLTHACAGLSLRRHRQAALRLARLPCSAHPRLCHPRHRPCPAPAGVARSLDLRQWRLVPVRDLVDAVMQRQHYAVGRRAIRWRADQCDRRRRALHAGHVGLVG